MPSEANRSAAVFPVLSGKYRDNGRRRIVQPPNAVNSSFRSTTCHEFPDSAEQRIALASQRIRCADQRPSLNRLEKAYTGAVEVMQSRESARGRYAKSYQLTASRWLRVEAIHVHLGRAEKALRAVIVDLHMRLRVLAR